MTIFLITIAFGMSMAGWRKTYIGRQSNAINAKRVDAYRNFVIPNSLLMGLYENSLMVYIGKEVINNPRLIMTPPCSLTNEVYPHGTPYKTPVLANAA